MRVGGRILEDLAVGQVWGLHGDVLTRTIVELGDERVRYVTDGGGPLLVQECSVSQFKRWLNGGRYGPHLKSLLRMADLDVLRVERAKILEHAFGKGF